MFDWLPACDIRTTGREQHARLSVRHFFPCVISLRVQAQIFFSGSGSGAFGCLSPPRRCLDISSTQEEEILANDKSLNSLPILPIFS
jgi:hypothetical protein